MPDEPIYFASAGGTKKGPLSGAELEALARDGELAPDDLVWRSGTTEWLKATAYVEFGSPFPEAEEEPFLEASGIRPPPPAPPGPSTPLAPAASPAPAEPAPVETREGVEPSEVAEPPRDELRPGPPSPPARGFGELARRLADDLRRVPFGEAFPFRRLFDPEALGAPAAILLLAFGLGPLWIATIVEDPAARVHLLNLCLGSLWATFLVLVFSPKPASPKLGTAVFLSSIVLGALLASLFPGLLPLSWLRALGEPSRAFPVRLLAALPAAFFEESGKGLILFLLARRLGRLAGPDDGLANGLLAGLGFGIWEATVSTGWESPGDLVKLTFTTGSVSAGLYGFVVSSVVTTAAITLLHAAWSGLVGYVLGLAATRAERPEAYLVAGVLAATLLHSLYVAFRSGGSSFFAFLIAAAALLLLVACRRDVAPADEGDLVSDVAEGESK